MQLYAVWSSLCSSLCVHNIFLISALNTAGDGVLIMKISNTFYERTAWTEKECPKNGDIFVILSGIFVSLRESIRHLLHLCRALTPPRLSHEHILSNLKTIQQCPRFSQSGFTFLLKFLNLCHNLAYCPTQTYCNAAPEAAHTRRFSSIVEDKARGEY